METFLGGLGFEDEPFVVEYVSEDIEEDIALLLDQISSGPEQISSAADLDFLDF